MTKKTVLITFPMLAACLFILLAAAGSPTNSVLAAELSLPKVVASSGDTVTVSIKYRAHGDAVSALGFDLAYDAPTKAPRSLTITGFTPGSAATAAGKDVVANLSLGEGVSRFLIFGLNQNVINDGDLVDLTVEVQDDFAPDTLRLHVFNLSCADPQAEEVFCGGADGKIQVKGK